MKMIEEIKSIIEQHLDDNRFSVEILSQKAAMSKPQLYRKLKSEAGVSAGQLITRLRVHKAKKMLEESDQQIASIAYQTGFSDPDYFSKVFKKEVGMNPSEYRYREGEIVREWVWGFMVVGSLEQKIWQ